MTMTTDRPVESEIVFDLTLTAAQESLRQRVNTFAKDVLWPGATAAEADGVDLADLARQLDGLGIHPASLLGDEPVDPLTLFVAVEELAYGDPGVAWAVAGSLQTALLIATCGDAEQRAALRARLSEAPASTLSALLYEDFGRAPSEYETTATQGDDGWVVTGRKTSVNHPAAADVSVIVARNAVNGELAAFTSTTNEGLVADRDDRAAGKLALTAVPSGPVSIASWTVPEDARLAGGLELHRAVAAARLLVAAALIGTARASTEYAAAYALERSTFGQRLSEYQGVTFPLVEHSTLIDEVRLLGWDAATSLTRLNDAAAIEQLTGHAVNRAAAVGLKACRDGVQLIGVRGIVRELPQEGRYRAAGVLAAIDFDPLLAPIGL